MQIAHERAHIQQRIFGAQQHERPVKRGPLILIFGHDARHEQRLLQPSRAHIARKQRGVTDHIAHAHVAQAVHHADLAAAQCAQIMSASLGGDVADLRDFALFCALIQPVRALARDCEGHQIAVFQRARKHAHIRAAPHGRVLVQREHNAADRVRAVGRAVGQRRNRVEQRLHALIFQRGAGKNGRETAGAEQSGAFAGELFTRIDCAGEIILHGCVALVGQRGHERFVVTPFGGVAREQRARLLQHGRKVRALAIHLVHKNQRRNALAAQAFKQQLGLRLNAVHAA